MRLRDKLKRIESKLGLGAPAGFCDCSRGGPLVLYRREGEGQASDAVPVDCDHCGRCRQKIIVEIVASSWA